MTTPAGLTWSRRIAFAAMALSATWVVTALLTWRDLENGPRVGSPWKPHYGQALLLQGGLQVVPLIAAAALIVAAMLIGHALVIRPVWGARRLASTPWLIFAGAPPGMLLIAASSRLATLVAPNAYAPALVGALILAALGLTVVRPLLGEDRGAPEWSAWLPAALAAGAALVFSVHIDDEGVIGGGAVWFLRDFYLAAAHGIGASGHWPLVSQHYDEAGFLYPVVYGLVTPGWTAEGTLKAIYWLSNAAGRLGMTSLLYLGIRGLGLDRFSTLALCLFACGASLSLNPVSSYLLFDSLNPLFYTLHMARFLAPVLPLLWISASAGLAERRPTIAGLAVALVLGLGASSLPIHTAMPLAWGFVVLALTALNPSAARENSLWRSGCVAALGVLAAMSLAYGLQGAPDLLKVALLIAATLGGALALLWALARAPQIGAADTRLGFAPSSWIAIVSGRLPASADNALLRAAPFWISLGVGYALGMLFLGNMLAHKAHAVLGGLWPWSELSIIDRNFSTYATHGLVIGQSEFCGSHHLWGTRTLTQHCDSLPMFSRVYGLSAVVITLTTAWWLRRGDRAHGIPNGLLTMLFWGVLTALLAQPLAFVAYDFLSAQGFGSLDDKFLSMWLRSRLLEPWLYGGSLLAIALFLRAAADRERLWTQMLLLGATAVYLLNPLVLPAHLVTNAAYLVKTVIEQLASGR